VAELDSVQVRKKLIVQQRQSIADAESLSSSENWPLVTSRVTVNSVRQVSLAHGTGHRPLRMAGAGSRDWLEAKSFMAVVGIDELLRAAIAGVALAVRIFHSVRCLQALDVFVGEVCSLAPAKTNALYQCRVLGRDQCR